MAESVAMATDSAASFMLTAQVFTEAGEEVGSA